MELLFTCNQEKTKATCRGISAKEYNGDVIIPETYEGMPVISIGYEAFNKSKIKSVHIPQTVTTIEMSAFSYCENLQKVTFYEGSHLEIIETMAFSGCRNLTFIHLPDNVRVIEYMAFNHCVNCTAEIPDRTLVLCPSFEGLRKVISYEPNLPPPAPIEKDVHGNCFRLTQGRNGYIVVKMLAEDDTTIRVPERFNGLPILELGDMAFSQNTEASCAILPSGVTKAGYMPFYGCKEMGYVEYGGTIAGFQKMKLRCDWFDVHCKDGILAGCK